MESHILQGRGKGGVTGRGEGGGGVWKSPKFDSVRLHAISKAEDVYDNVASSQWEASTWLP